MFNKDFYPTPSSLIEKMLSKIYIENYDNILEPSAGKGDIADYIVRRLSTASYYNKDKHKKKIDAIEKEDELRATLKGKGYRVIDNDFLTFETRKSYGLIIMNPPFSEGDKHLLKAIKLQERGGEIVCILNAETIRNPYSNTRKELINLLNYYDADIEFLKEEFVNAERTTNVEIALIYISIERNFRDSLIIDNLKNNRRRYNLEFTEKNQIISADPIESAIQNFNFEVDAGLKLIYNYFELLPLIKRSLKDKTSSPALTLSIRGEQTYNTTPSIVNEYIEEIRYKYWSGLINMNHMRQLLTSNLRQEFNDKLIELRGYDFTRHNVDEVMKSIMDNLTVSIEDTIMTLFDELTSKYTYNDYNGNLHLYNGWKTNIGYKINDKKVILPLNGYHDWGNGRVYFGFDVEEKLRDMQKSLEYLEGGKTKGFDNIREILEEAKEKQNDEVEFKYFTIKFYRKGTGHVYWKDKDLVKKLNIFGAKKRNWLPDNYGTKKYNDMSKEEKEVVKEFEGVKEYEKTICNSEYLLTTPTAQTLMLQG